ncbi:MAG: ABC transporter ATP-binding protein [Blastocatellia bacterium]
MAVLKAEHVFKSHLTPDHSLRDVSLAIDAGEFVVVSDPTGSRAASLLRICGLLDKPDAGEVFVNGTATASLPETDRARLQHRQIGLVFPFSQLAPALSVLDNIAGPLRNDPESTTSAITWAEMMAERMGLEDRMNALPAVLSPDEMLRASIARAIIHSPSLLIADESVFPASATSAQRLQHLLTNLNRELRLAMLLATSDPARISTPHRLVTMENGKILQDMPLARNPSR